MAKQRDLLLQMKEQAILSSSTFEKQLLEHATRIQFGVVSYIWYHLSTPYTHINIFDVFDMFSNYLHGWSRMNLLGRNLQHHVLFPIATPKFAKWDP